MSSMAKMLRKALNVMKRQMGVTDETALNLIRANGDENFLLNVVKMRASQNKSFLQNSCCLVDNHEQSFYVKN